MSQENTEMRMANERSFSVLLRRTLKWVLKTA